MANSTFTNWKSMTDKGLSKQIGSYIKYHRVNQNKSQDELAKLAGISRSTLSLLERGESVTINTLLQVLRVLDLLNIMEFFKVETIISPIALAKMEQGKRQRATKSKDNTKNQSDW